MEENEKKRSFIFDYIPAKNDKPSDFIRKIIFMLSAVIFVVCAVILIIWLIGEKADEARTNELRELKEQAELAALTEPPYNIDGDISIDAAEGETEKVMPPILDEYKELYELNNDLVGWVKIDGTLVDYPVLQTEDNSFYIDHNFDKEESKLGAIFADFVYPITDVRPNNTILYGHNISAGTYFAGLTYYYPAKHDGMGFYNAHPTISFDTIYEKGTYKIFGVIFINTNEKHGDVYKYFTKRRFNDRGEFYDFCANILDRSTILTDVDLQYGDEILTLSTCYYPYGKDVDTRVAVFARRVRDGESAEVDTSNAVRNKSALFFDYYYRVNGGSWAGRSWDTSLIEGFDEYAKTHPDLGAAKLMPKDETE